MFGCLVLSDSFVNSMGSNPPGSSVHGISQARILEWVAISSSRGSSQLKDKTCIGSGFFTTESPGKPQEILFSSVQLLSCVQLCSPMNCSTPGFPVHHQLLKLPQIHVHQVGYTIHIIIRIIRILILLEFLKY